MNYHGSLYFQSVADLVGLPVYHFNFLFSQFVALLFAFFYRAKLKPTSDVNKSNVVIQIRHLFSITVGLGLCHFCFGYQTLHILLQTLFAYLSFKFVPRQYVHVFIIVFSMSYLCWLHLYGQIYEYGNYTFDITSPMMITTQKLTSMAFSYYDGSRSPESLTEDQKSQVIKKMPSLLELLSYILNFQGIVVGPLCFYNDYIEFIDGTNISKHHKNKTGLIGEPSVASAIFTKLFGAFFYAAAHLFLIRSFSFNNYFELKNEPIWYQIFFLHVSAFAFRVKFYLVWLLAEAVNNASGLGFNGYDEDGSPKWDLITNIKTTKLETATNIKTIFDNWNIQTQLWLRRIAYDRLSKFKAFNVFIFSAMWHGFYPGYYFTFIFCFLMVDCGRKIRHHIRPIFQKNRFTILFYDILTWYIISFQFSYTSYSFTVLEFWKSIKFYNSWYWFAHVAVLLLSIVLPAKQRSKSQNTNGIKKTN